MYEDSPKREPRLQPGRDALPCRPHTGTWTVLVYLAGEESLSDAMVLSLKDMYRVRAASETHLVVQFNPREGPPRRFAITGSDTDPQLDIGDGRIDKLGEVLAGQEAVQSDPVETPDPDATANLAAVEDFVVAGITENPSDYTFVVLSGHASGVVGKQSHEHGFSPNATRSLDLGPMFESVKKRTGRVVDVVGFDACFMAMCEVCWDLRDSARFLIASEGLTPGSGWPYDRILGVFRDNEALAAAQLVERIVSKYLRYNHDFVLSGRSVDLAACRLDRAEAMAAAVQRLAEALAKHLDDPDVRDQMILAHWKAQSYKGEQYVDLWDFCDLLEESCGPEIRDACRAVKESLASPSEGMVMKSIYSGPSYQHSHGLSLYFPWSEVSPRYADSAFARATGWVDFLEEYVKATRREMRGESRPRRHVDKGGREHECG